MGKLIEKAAALSWGMFIRALTTYKLELNTPYIRIPGSSKFLFKLTSGAPTGTPNTLFAVDVDSANNNALFYSGATGSWVANTW